MAGAITHADLANMATRLENSIAIANAMSGEKITKAVKKAMSSKEVKQSFLSHLVDIVISQCIHVQSDPKID